MCWCNIVHSVALFGSYLTSDNASLQCIVFVCISPASNNVSTVCPPSITVYYRVHCVSPCPLCITMSTVYYCVSSCTLCITVSTVYHSVHSVSLCIIVYHRVHCVSLCITVYHRVHCVSLCPLCVIVYHCVSLCITVYHHVHCVSLCPLCITVSTVYHCVSLCPLCVIVHHRVHCVSLCITVSVIWYLHLHFCSCEYEFMQERVVVRLWEVARFNLELCDVRLSTSSQPHRNLCVCTVRSRRCRSCCGSLLVTLYVISCAHTQTVQGLVLVLVLLAAVS